MTEGKIEATIGRDDGPVELPAGPKHALCARPEMFAIPLKKTDAKGLDLVKPITKFIASDWSQEDADACRLHCGQGAWLCIAALTTVDLPQARLATYEF